MDPPKLIKKEERLISWDSDDQLLTDHTSIPLPPVTQPDDSEPVNQSNTSDAIQILEQEVGYLKNIVARHGDIVVSLGDRALSSSRPTSGNTKPRDIPILQLQELQGLNSTTKLQIFFELVEQCSEDDHRRVQIAKGRVSSELAALIHNRQTSHLCNTWPELKLLLKTEFSTDVNFDRAWQDINTSYYDWADSPQAFVNQFICQYAILETRFPKEKLPNRDKTIKKKLWQGLTQDAKERLEGFLDEDYPLAKFIDRVEHERQRLEASHSSPLFRVKEEKKDEQERNLTTMKTPTMTDNNKTNATSRESSNKVDSLERQIKALTEELEKLRSSSKKTPPQEYCSYCRSSTHALRDCWRKPSRGSCFDCRRYGCWRGNRDCPGKRAGQA